MRSFLLAAALALSACTTLPPPDQVAATHPLPTAAMDGIVTNSLSGELRRRGDCLLLLVERGDRTVPFLLIWPEGSRFDGRRIAIAQQQGAPVVQLGDRLTVEGGSPPWADYLVQTFPQLRPWQARCGAPPMFGDLIRRG
jgi:hypothetical protein